MKQIFPVIEHRFAKKDVIAGDPALDFVNTVNGRDQTPMDWLDSYARMLEWAAVAELLPADVLELLAHKARKNPVVAAASLEQAKLLREALFALLTALISGASPPKKALTLVREHWVAGVQAHELCLDAGSVIPRLRREAVGLELIAAVVAYRAVQYVLPLPAHRLRLCDGPNCAWLFIDSSKAGRRRWCDMAVCGNAAKSRRFYARARE
jgi:predicted RNA-binding Zn ribbon-like protein